MIVLAHPLTQSWELPVSPMFVVAVAVCLLAGATALALRPAFAARAATPSPSTPTEGPLFWLGRALGLALLVFAVVVGRFGHPAELSNMAPALIVGAGWPVLVLAAALVGDVWRRLNPFDTIGRALAPLGAGEGTDDALNLAWAVPAAGLWVAYLTMWPNHLAPRTVAGALIVYTVATAAGVLAFGRRTWLSSGEVFTVFFGLIATVRRYGTAATMPAGAHLVLGVLCGGFVYGLLRDSQLLLGIGYGPRATVYSALALAATVALTVGAAHLAQRRAQRHGAQSAVAVALVVAAGALAITLALARNRLTTSLQLLPVLASDPMGRGHNLFGTTDWVLQGRPLGIAGLLLVQLCILTLGCALAGVLAARIVRRLAVDRPRLAVSPAVQLLALVLAVAAAGVSATAF